jgi:geranylgeranyl reductase family protein
MYDVAIVGAGPAGLMCATELEKLGEKVVVIEKNKKVGEVVECAGLFNIAGLKRLGIEKGDYVLNEARGARFISMSGSVAEVKGKDSKAYIVDRGKFDRFLANRYKGELILGKEVKSARKKGDHYELDVGRLIEAKHAVLATGHKTSLHKSLGFKAPSRFVSTSQYEINGVNVDKDFVELYLGSVAPGFFAWVIPIDEKNARVGLGVLDAKESTHHYMEAFLKRLKKEGRFKEKNKVLHKSGGLIPVFEPNLEVGHDYAYLVGDAASHVKATTGGGVVMGGLAAKALAKAIHENINYGLTLMEISKELNNHLLIRNVINKFGDDQYEHMIEFLNKPDVKKLIEEQGDMDLIAPIMQGIMKNPALLMKAMKFMGGGLLF